MCGRVRITTQAAEIAAAYDAKADANALIFRAGDRTPSEQVLTISGGEAGREADTNIWGKPECWLPPGQLLRHARAETALTKPTFREAARSRRCIVPVDAWFERGTRPGVPRGPHCISAQDGRITGLAALYWPPTVRGAYPRLVIVTKQAMGATNEIHHQTPMAVLDNEIDAWLDAQTGIDAVRALLARPSAAEGVFRTGL